MTDRQRDRDQPTDADPGAYVGHEPEWAAETIPGGVGPKDERVSAVGTRSSGDGANAGRAQQPDPAGHREGANATDDDVREAGQNR